LAAIGPTHQPRLFHPHLSPHPVSISMWRLITSLA